MKVLVISYMFPCKRHPISGIFFANLLKELAGKLDELIVVTPRPYIPRFLTRIKKSWNKWYIDPLTTKANNIEIIRPKVIETTGLGAAFGSAIGIGILKSVHDVNKFWKEDKTFRPIKDIYYNEKKELWEKSLKKYYQ